MTTSAKRCTVLLTFDFDAESSKMAKGLTTPTALSQGEYGPRVGLPRVIDLLNKYEIKSTFFVPGIVAEMHPEQVQQLHAAGHEIGHHGYTHITPVTLNYEDEREQVRMGMEAIEKVVGIRPKGYRSPAWDLSNNSIELFKEFGMEYEASLMGDDFRFYRVGTEDGSAGLVAIPIAWILDDYIHFEIVENGTGISTPSKVYELWAGEFDGAYAEGGTICFTMHPQVIGRWPRMRMLEQLIQYMRGHAGVEFMTCAQAVAEWQQANPLK